MTPEDKRRLAEIRELQTVAWQGQPYAAGYNKTAFLLRLLDEALAERDRCREAKAIEVERKDAAMAALQPRCPHTGNPIYPRAGRTFSEVVAWLPREREWTVAELKAALPQHGAKQIANVLGNLVRRGHVARLGYGRYTAANERVGDG